MHPLSLFRNFKEVGIFVFGLIFIAILNLSISYHSFLEFKKSPYFEGEILSVNYKENKNNKPYFSFVIDAGSFKIFSTRWGANMPYRGRVSFSIIKEKVSFVDFLKGSFYAPTYAFSQLHVDGFKSSIKEKIGNDKM